MPDSLYIRMFGRFSVALGDRVISRFSTQKASALLAYLAYFPASHPRELLVDLLWPDSELDAGRASLSQALSMLRRQLEPPGARAGSIIQATRAHVGLNPAVVRTDVADFHAARERARRSTGRVERAEALAVAAGLYAGALLPGFYDDWVQTEGQRLAALYFGGVDELVAVYERGGELSEALECARAALAMDPVREESHRAVMRILAASGRQAEALRQYAELRRVLEEDLGDEPSPTTRRLADEIERMQAPTPISPTRPGRKIGRDLPRGTVTFLMAETEGLTADASPISAAADQSFGRGLSAQFARHSGHIVREDDGTWLAAFESPSAAVGCAVECQREPSGARGAHGDDQPQAGFRIAVHTGEVALADGEYQGAALQRVARILAASHVGQILVSEAVDSIIRRDLPAGMRLVDLGVYRLRDANAPEHLFQVSYDGMPVREFPPPRAEAGYQSNLPLQFTRFFGREEQLAQLTAMLQSQETRLVTITGPGGTGKTRLALEVANRLLEPFAGAVWFVPLVDLSDAGLIAGAIVDSLRIPRAPNADPLDQAVAALGRQPSLLVLDNLEQFVEAGSDLVRQLLQQVPQLTCLVTSRQSLSLGAEREYPLTPLATPNGPGTPERLTMFESVRLFVDRAQAVKPDFQVTNLNAPAVAELCDRLEGIPLAIELAAARASSLSPGQMLHQLERRFEFLVSRRRDFAARHRTLRAALDWSYELLPVGAQRYLACLSVFRGTFSLESAAHVCECDNAPDQLHLLVRSSLLLAQDLGEKTRFRMLETVREYAQSKVGVAFEQLRDRHAAWMLALAEEAEPFLSGPRQVEYLALLDADNDNLRSAQDWLAASSQHEKQLRFAGALGRFWFVRGHIAEGRARLAAALGSSGTQVPTNARARALQSAGRLSRVAGDLVAARDLHVESLAISQKLGDAAGVAWARLSLGVLADNACDIPEARRQFLGCLDLFRSLGDRQKTALCLNNLGNLAAEEQDFTAARAFYEEGLRIGREAGDLETLSMLVGNVGLTAMCQDDLATARGLFEESLAIRRKLGTPIGVAGSLSNLGFIALLEGDLSGARSLTEEAAQMQREIGDSGGMAYSIEAFGLIFAAERKMGLSVRLLSAAAAWRAASGVALPAYYTRAIDVVLTEAKSSLGAASYQGAWTDGAALALDSAVKMVLPE